LLNLGKPATSIHSEELLKPRALTSFPKKLEGEGKYLIFPSAIGMKHLVNNPTIGWIEIYL
jgi:hypothetical protein